MFHLRREICRFIVADSFNESISCFQCVIKCSKVERSGCINGSFNYFYVEEFRGINIKRI